VFLFFPDFFLCFFLSEKAEGVSACAASHIIGQLLGQRSPSVLEKREHGQFNKKHAFKCGLKA